MGKNGKNANFRPISRHISEMIEDRHSVTIVDYVIRIYGLSRLVPISMTLNDFERLTQNFTQLLPELVVYK